MSLVELKDVIRVGVDLAKSVIQIHAVTAEGRVFSNRPLAREKFVSWCAQLSRGTVVAMEACSGAHHWARELTAIGLEAKLVSAVLVAPYRLQGRMGKNDANDAMAICEAASRPTMRYIPIKTIEQQGVMTLHRLREGIKKDRTACINRIRGLLAEFGLVFPRSPQALRAGISEVLSAGPVVLHSHARLGLQTAALHLSQLDAHLKACDRSIGSHCRADPKARAAAALQGIGPIGASALIASVGDLSAFKRAPQFGAWLGLTPRQHSSGGAVSLGRITKRGDPYLRALLIQGAKGAVITAHKRSDSISRWALQLRERVGWQKASVAMANKNARILWAILSKGCVFNPNHAASPRHAQRCLF